MGIWRIELGDGRVASSSSLFFWVLLFDVFLREPFTYTSRRGRLCAVVRDYWDVEHCWVDWGDSWPALADEERGLLNPPENLLFCISFYSRKITLKSWVIYCDLLPNVDLVCVGHRSLFRNDGFNVKGKGATGCFGTIVFSTATRAVHSRSFYF